MVRCVAMVMVLCTSSMLTLAEEADPRPVVEKIYVDSPDLEAEAQGLIRCQALPFVGYRRRGRSFKVQYLPKEQLRRSGLIIGNVTKIQDGDTFEIKDVLDQRVTIHLDGANAPEFGQPFGQEAAERLRELLPVGARVFCRISPGSLGGLNRSLGPMMHRDFMAAREEFVCTVNVDYGEIENRYRSLLGDIGLRMVASGHAWYDGIVNGKPLPELAKVKEQKLGLWGQENPQNPLLWFKNDLEQKRKASWPLQGRIEGLSRNRMARMGGAGGKGYIRDVSGVISYIEFLRIYNVEPFIELTYGQAEQLSEIRNPEADATTDDFDRSNRQVFAILESNQETQIRQLAHHRLFAYRRYEMAAAQVPNSLSPKHVAKLKELTSQYTIARNRLIRTAGGKVATRKTRYQQKQLAVRFRQAIQNALPERYSETVGPRKIVQSDDLGSMGSMFGPTQPYPRVF